FRAQALNDFLVFGVQATASLSAGAVLELAGWGTINVIGISLVVLTFILLLRAREVLILGRGVELSKQA
ncbi:MAG: hypothetical protein PVF18_11405, partial [Anaerolineales bacterium]